MKYILYLLICMIGFWGENGYRSFDLILGWAGLEKSIYGYIHCESDVISLINKRKYNMQVDIGKDGFIRLFNDRGFNLIDINLSNITIESIE